jgi:hypothetical protein
VAKVGNSILYQLLICLLGSTDVNYHSLNFLGPSNHTKLLSLRSQ